MLGEGPSRWTRASVLGLCAREQVPRLSRAAWEKEASKGRWGALSQVLELGHHGGPPGAVPCVARLTICRMLLDDAG